MSTIVHLPSSARAVLSGGGAAPAWAPGQQSGAGKTGWGLSLAAKGCCAAAAGVLRLPAAPGAPVRLQIAGGAEGACRRSSARRWGGGGLWGVWLRGRCQDSLREREARKSLAGERVPAGKGGAAAGAAARRAGGGSPGRRGAQRGVGARLSCHLVYFIPGLASCLKCGAFHRVWRGRPGSGWGVSAQLLSAGALPRPCVLPAFSVWPALEEWSLLVLALCAWGGFASSA